MVDGEGGTVGLVGTRLSVLWLLDFAESMQEELRGVAGTQALLLDRDGVVLIGSEGLKGKRLGVPGDTPERAVAAPAGDVVANSAAHPARVERLAAVSYTHLDVYKRQVSVRVMPAGALEVVASPTGGSAGGEDSRRN